MHGFQQQLAFGLHCGIDVYLNDITFVLQSDCSSSQKLLQRLLSHLDPITQKVTTALSKVLHKVTKLKQAEQHEGKVKDKDEGKVKGKVRGPVQIYNDEDSRLFVKEEIQPTMFHDVIVEVGILVSTWLQILHVWNVICGNSYFH